MDAALKGHLPRLSPEHDRGRTIVHWTLTIERRAKGWLTPDFHLRGQLALRHACTRYDLLCPAYVPMPDHGHLLWIEWNGRGSDQRIAAEFLRKNMRPHLASAAWQQQAHDHVLRGAEREHDAFRTIASYIFANPVWAGLISDRSHYPFLGACAPGYPDLDVRRGDYRELFWRIHNKVVERY